MTEKKPLKQRMAEHVVTSCLMAVLFLFLGQIAGSIPTNLLYLVFPTDEMYTAMLYFAYFGIWIIVLLYLYLDKTGKQMRVYFGSRTRANNVPMFLLGLLIGAVQNMICIAAAWLHGDIKLTFDAFHPASFVLILFCVFVQSGAEELLCRGFLYRRIRLYNQNPLVAIIGNALLFAVLHTLNEGVTVLSIINIFVVGIFYSLVVYYTDSLWCVIAMHTAWNFTQNIFFGLPNSGVVVPYSVFRLEASTARNSFAYNVGFGVEGTIVCDLLLIASCVIVVLLGRKRGQRTGSSEE